MQPTPGTQINPRVRLVRPLGEGSMGAIWLAEHTTLGTEVAVKFIAKELAEEDDIHERFQREARAAAQIKSPNVVQILDHGFTDEGVPYIVMELLEGQTLAHALEDGPLSLDQTVLVVTQVCRALAKAHVVGIIHRDIKPENILIDEDLRVRLTDFGLCELTLDGDRESTPTKEHQVVGTPHYMAPEQLQPGESISPATDLYSLGVVLYEMLTGELPLGRFRSPSSHPGVAAWLDPIVAKCLARDPAQRFRSASELRAALSRPASATAAERSAGDAEDSRTNRADDERPAPGDVAWFGSLAGLTAILSLFLPWYEGPMDPSRVYGLHVREPRAEVIGWYLVEYDLPTALLAVHAAAFVVLAALRLRCRGIPRRTLLIPAVLGVAQTCMHMWVVSRRDAAIEYPSMVACCTFLVMVFLALERRR